jgi:hypothetical protein
LGVKPPPTASFRIAFRLAAPSVLAAALREAHFTDVVIERSPIVARYGSLHEAVQQAMDHAGTREIVKLLAGDSTERMSRSLALRWRKYAVHGGVHLPGEQLVTAGTKTG